MICAMYLSPVLIIYCFYLQQARAKCIKRPGERYSPHFEGLPMGEIDCMKKCENNTKCYRATWIGRSCYLHGDNFFKGKDVNSVGYICKADCVRNGQKFTSQKYEFTSNCQEKCRCTLVGKPDCKNSCRTTSIKCVSPEVKVQYAMPLVGSCFCGKLCVVPGNFGIKVKQGETIAIGCSFSTLYWTFNGKTLKNIAKYKFKRNSIEVRNVQKTDVGSYTCGDKKYYNIHLTEDTCSSTNTIYIVVCGVASFLVVVLLIILFIYKYRNVERSKVNNNTKARVEIPAPNIDDAKYVELGEHIRGSYTGLNASNVATYENSHYGYEVSPASVNETK
ncbi:uncharacterized protein LOC130623443 [Hydractinia symbiolongicarpus]|uniref:uncharacterized protein LOC130623443 n=1 Tax=Hydractinia symbiolongicarpus TaxID=13093 RepID=UPI00254FD0F0|nr:uncharacterized protein LOC130623443 [Hydractinia symbiolongicarpus]